MAKFSERKAQKGPEKARMYPNNGLKDPVRKFDSTYSAMNVLAKMFLTPKAGA